MFLSTVLLIHIHIHNHIRISSNNKTKYNECNIGYCSGCWQDWSSHSSTCPHCRGEIKECQGREEEGGDEGATGKGHDGCEDIWQYESWDESDMHSHLEKITTQLIHYVRELPRDLTREMMTSHCILSPHSSSSASSSSSLHSSSSSLS